MSDTPAPPAAPVDNEPLDVDGDDDYGAPFVPKTFGGAFVWARSDSYVASILRLREGKSVPVSTDGRRDMMLMLTGGRAVLEATPSDGGATEQSELDPATPVTIEDGKRCRVVALTEVEIMTIYAPL